MSSLGRPAVDTLVHLLRGRGTVVLAGAGCSTESGIPDYGGLDSKRRRSLVQYRAFVDDESMRTRYWARSTVGWPRVVSARPNPAHRALAALERSGAVIGVITQNVDGLHHRAGSRRIVELHGSLLLVRCVGCNAVEPRASVQERLLALNPGFAGGTVDFTPDGDAEVAEERLCAFRVPGCSSCGGVLKPDVVFFGENVPKTRVREAWALYEEADVLLVVGSSLAVFSGFRFVQRAMSDKRPVAIVNVGPTRGDDLATLKIEARLGTVLPAVANILCGGDTVAPPAA